MHSLWSRHPWRLDVPVLLLASLVLLILGLTMPVMEIRAFIFWRSEVSILTNIKGMYDNGREPAAIAMGFCSVVYPLGKILALSFFFAGPFPAGGRRVLIRLMRLMGRWSMLDVFAITALVVGSRVIFLVEAKPLPGIYVYAASIFTLMLATVLIDRLTRRGHRIRR